jgi:hypothetical protein
VIFVASDQSLSTKAVAEDEPASAEGGRVEYNGTANAKMEFCFGRTVSSWKGFVATILSDCDAQTFKLIFLCHHFESILRFVDDDTRQSNKAWIFTLFNYGDDAQNIIQ